MSLGADAQNYDLSVFRKGVDSWPSLRGCAFGETRGVVAWYSSNGYRYAYADQKVRDILSQVNSNSQYIDYISLADNGNYVIISENGKRWHARGPQSFYDALNSVADNGGIKSATIDINNHYFIIGKNGTIKTNYDSWRSFYNSHKSSMGEGRSAWSNGNAFVVCFDRGVKYMGEVPVNVCEKLNEIDFIPDFVQFGKCGNYTISTNKGRAKYRIEDFGRYDKAPCINLLPASGTVPSTPGYYPSTPSVPTTYPCGVCNSTGRCLKCNGTGIGPNHAPGIIANCGYCGGTGRCGTCHGRGYN